MPEDQPVVKVLVEIPKGSRNKYEYNRETGELELDRRVFAAVTYPTEYGFVQQTLAEDGDELDAMVVVTEPTFPGCVVPIKPIALLRMYDGETPDHKVLGVPLRDPGWDSLDGLEDLPGDLAEEIMHFFKVYADLRPGDRPRIDGWGSQRDARATISEARERYRASQA
jgi:inorganic pyrophosphatase